MPLKKPRLLIVTTEANPATDRLIQALNEIGFGIGFGQWRLAPASASGNLARCDTGRPVAIPHGGRARDSTGYAGYDCTHGQIGDAAIAPNPRISCRWNRPRLHPHHPHHRKFAGRSTIPIGFTANPLALARFNRQHKVSAPSSVEVTDETALRAVLQSVPLPVILKSGDAWDGCGRCACARR